jgi:AcrR family transcriptional regulator
LYHDIKFFNLNPPDLMNETGTLSLREKNRQQARQAILDGAERLLRSSPAAEFSMRALAAEAGVGFATPFNHFGNKNAIMQALSSRLIEQMIQRFRIEDPAGDCLDRVLAMGNLCVTLLRQKPEIHKAVVGSLGMPQSGRSEVHSRSRELWSLALGDFGGLAPATRPLAEAILAEQLAFHFRGCISFWIAGELPDRELAPTFRSGAASLLLGFAQTNRRIFLLEQVASSARLVVGRLPSSGTKVLKTTASGS